MTKISVCIDVSHMENAIQFYTQALACELVEKKSDYSELVLDGLTIYLAENPEGSNPLVNAQAVRSYERHWTPVHLDFKVSDLEQCVSSIVALGGKKEGEKSGDWGAIAFCADPFGNGFCVMQLKE